MNNYSRLKLIFSILLVLSIISSIYVDSAETDKTPTKENTDHRTLVTMPDQARNLMRTDMINHLATINEILGLLANEKFESAAQIAEAKLGRSTMGKHRGSGMGPGRFMPTEMRNLGMGMHDAASEFTQVVREGNLKDSYTAFQKVTSYCVACHYSYRTR